MLLTIFFNMEKKICGKVPNGDGSYQLFYRGQENEFAEALSKLHQPRPNFNIIYANLKNKIKSTDLTLTELNFLMRHYLLEQEKELGDIK